MLIALSEGQPQPGSAITHSEFERAKLEFSLLTSAKASELINSRFMRTCMPAFAPKLSGRRRRAARRRAGSGRAPRWSNTFFCRFGAVAAHPFHLRGEKHGRWGLFPWGRGETELPILLQGSNNKRPSTASGIFLRL